MHEYMTVELSTDYSNCSFWGVEGCFESYEERESVVRMYPDGLSNHGKFYLMNFDIRKLNHFGHAEPFVWNEPMMECVFEFIRVTEFPERPSRFQSMFAWRNLADANFFIGQQQLQDFHVYEVESDSCFIGDMRLIFLSANLISSYEMARRYWAGESSASPLHEVLIPLPATIGKQIDTELVLGNAR